MACNSCAKSFSLLRKEKGCPSCGFSYCSNCLCNKVFLPKLNSETKVCPKCKHHLTTNNENGAKEIQPPDAYYKRVGAAENKANSSKALSRGKSTDEEILERLKKLKQDKPESKGTADEDIARRLQSIKDVMPSTSDAELHLRLAKLKGLPETVEQGKPVLPIKDLRSEQEQVDDLMNQYLEQTKIDTKYKEGFDEKVDDIESRVQKLKESSGPSSSQNMPNQDNAESEDEEEIVSKIIEKVNDEASLEEHEISSQTNDELPFCEVCDEDANVRCLGCRYLFCIRCFMEHKDDDYGCIKYEPYEPPILFKD